MRWIMPLMLTGLWALATTPDSRAQDVEHLARTFETEFSAALDEEAVPGGAFAVVHRGRVLRVGTFGHLDNQRSRAVTPETVFRVASVSKGFAATAAAMLAAEGAFEWAEPITRYRPDFPDRRSSRPITVSDVIGQTTGYIPHAYDNLIEAGKPLDEIYRRFGELEPVCNPGACYTYQNGAFALIEPVLEQASGHDLPTLLRERLFAPLGMATASVGFDSFKATENRASPHVRARSSWHRVPVNGNYYAVNSAAGVNASILDMATWVNAMLGHHPEVLSTEVIDTVTTPRVATPRNLNHRYWRDHLHNAHYGKGWRVYQLGQQELVYHGGWVSGFRADAGFAPAHDLGLVMLLNAESSLISELSASFWSRALDETRLARRQADSKAGSAAGGADAGLAPAPQVQVQPE